MRPYPFERLRKMTRDGALDRSRWARSAPLAVMRQRGLEARGWLGAPLEFELGEAAPWADDAPLNEGAYVLLDGLQPAGLFLDSRIASAIIARCLGAGSDTVGARGPIGTVEAGVLTYAVARWLGEGAFSVGAVFGHAPALVEAVEPTLRWSMTLTLGEARGSGALWLPDPVGISPARPGPPPAWLPVVAHVDAGHAILSASAIASLGPGDVVIPDQLDVDLNGVGRVHLRVRGSSLTLVCRNASELTLEEIQDNALPTTRGRRAPPRERANMADETFAKLSDTPITLHVEIARVEMSLGDVASLAVGEVLRTSRTLSDKVTLRAGERAVARGELVDVDGELGVQITEVLR